jgi:ribosomal protein S18 acetylase RimI-like enzyme
MMILREARESDAPAMGQLMVETYLRAHKGQLPEGAWQKRQAEWTWEVSAAGWSGAIRDIADGTSPEECIYLAVDDETGEAPERIAGIAMGGAAGVGPWEGAGEIYALYIHHAYHRRGLGRKLVQAAVRHLRRQGMQQLVIRSLKTNEPANRFYAALGGQVVGQTDKEDYGYRYTELIFGWEDSAQLLSQSDEP